MRQVCDKYDLPYTTGNFLVQYGKTWRTIAKLSLPDKYLRDTRDDAPETRSERMFAELNRFRRHGSGHRPPSGLKSAIATVRAWRRDKRAAKRLEDRRGPGRLTSTDKGPPRTGRAFSRGAVEADTRLVPTYRTSRRVLSDDSRGYTLPCASVRNRMFSAVVDRTLAGICPRSGDTRFLRCTGRSPDIHHALASGILKSSPEHTGGRTPKTNSHEENSK